MSDAEKLVAWLREAADELERAHFYLDCQGAPRNNPEGGAPFTLAARIACVVKMEREIERLENQAALHPEDPA